jgi:hypothetical protein
MVLITSCFISCFVAIFLAALGFGQGTLPLEPHLQPFLFQFFFRKGLVVLAGDLPICASCVAGITGTSFCTVTNLKLHLPDI